MDKDELRAITDGILQGLVRSENWWSSRITLVSAIVGFVGLCITGGILYGGMVRNDAEHSREIASLKAEVVALHKSISENWSNHQDLRAAHAELSRAFEVVRRDGSPITRERLLLLEEQIRRLKL